MNQTLWKIDNYNKCNETGKVALLDLIESRTVSDVLNLNSTINYCVLEKTILDGDRPKYYIILMDTNLFIILIVVIDFLMIYASSLNK